MNSEEVFLPEIEEIYNGLHDWLAHLTDPPDYRKKSIESKINDALLSRRDMLSAAAQYYVLFPAHFFKVTHTLNNIIEIDTLQRFSLE